MARKTYTCDGAVRGSCGVEHHTLDACQAHCAADQRACRRLSPTAYSDRAPVSSDGSPARVCGQTCDHDECYQ